MAQDVDLMRDLLFRLESRQISPRQNVVISIEDEAEELGRMPEAIEDGLNTLLDLDYIDGAGPDEPGFWFFRKLTRKGIRFVEATRLPQDWARLKQHYSG